MTYYDLLGVGPSASREDLHRAYRAAIRRYHPDVNPAPNAAQMTVWLNDAWATLADPRRRAEYDESIGARPVYHANVWYADPGPTMSYVQPRPVEAFLANAVRIALLFAFVVSAVHWLPVAATICGGILAVRFMARHTG